MGKEQTEEIQGSINFEFSPFENPASFLRGIKSYNDELSS